MDNPYRLQLVKDTETSTLKLVDTKSNKTFGTFIPESIDEENEVHFYLEKKIISILNGRTKLTKTQRDMLSVEKIEVLNKGSLIRIHYDKNEGELSLYKYLDFDLKDKKLSYHNGELVKPSHLKSISLWFNDFSSINDNDKWAAFFLQSVSNIMRSNYFDKHRTIIENTQEVKFLLDVCEIIHKMGYPSSITEGDAIPHIMSCSNNEGRTIYSKLNVSKKMFKYFIEGYLTFNQFINVSLSNTRKKTNSSKFHYDVFSDTQMTYLNKALDYYTEELHLYITKGELSSNVLNRLLHIDQILDYFRRRTTPKFIELVEEYNYNFKKLLKYLIIETESQGIRNIYDTLSLLYDYIDMTKKMDIKITNKNKYPSYLKTQHDIAQKNFKLVENELLDKGIQKASLEYKDTLSYEDRSFTTVLPTGSSDFVKEGNSLHHCVASYAKRVSEGKTYVFFIRQKKNIEESLLTVEVNPPTKKIIQVKGQSNRSPNTIEKTFIKKLCKEKNLVYTV